MTHRSPGDVQRELTTVQARLKTKRFKTNPDLLRRTRNKVRALKREYATECERVGITW